MAFERGELVEVFDIKREIWLPAVVMMRWREQIIYRGAAEGGPTFSYEVEGTDDDGPFSGRWESKHVRARGRL